jgi:hypothetical protein
VRGRKADGTFANCGFGTSLHIADLYFRMLTVQRGLISSGPKCNGIRIMMSPELHGGIGITYPANDKSL